MTLDQALSPTIIVVANDLKLLKLLSLALKIEFACEVLSFISARSVEETIMYVRPDLLILDEHMVDCNARTFAARMHSIPGIEGVPTLFINGNISYQSESQEYVIRSLGSSWNIEVLYAAVYELFD
ncbi:MAG: hypothetical protein H0U76_16510 [Ktedonobacteraceae bacterium]|nr:hypothetical protein [Ktedonobacteraceae bacterium]